MLILLLSFAFACDNLKAVCHTVCLHDGDQMGIVLNQNCYCANARDVTKIVTTVPKTITYKDNKKRSWLDELY